MNVKLAKPYKISPVRLKRYETHYQIPAANSLVVPVKELGNEWSCDIRWEDSEGHLQFLQNKIFVKESLVPVNQFVDNKLYELWKHYYQPETI